MGTALCTVLPSPVYGTLQSGVPVTPLCLGHCRPVALLSPLPLTQSYFVNLGRPLLLDFFFSYIRGSRGHILIFLSSAFQLVRLVGLGFREY